MTAVSDSPGPTLASISSQLEYLTDLFQRRLSNDRSRSKAVELLNERLEMSERAAAGFQQLPIATELFLLVDRLDASAEGHAFIESVRDELLEVLQRHGFKQIADVDGEFDGNLHEVLETSPGGGSGTQLDAVLRRGFATETSIVRKVGVRLSTGEPSVELEP